MFYHDPLFPVICPPGFTYLAEVRACYYANRSKMTWLDARAECVRLGGYLAEIRSFSEATALRTFNLPGIRLEAIFKLHQEIGLGLRGCLCWME